MNRRDFLQSVGAASLTLGLRSARAGQKTNVLQRIPGRKPRNVVFILSDDHRYDFMGFMGKVKFLETPNMDRLAREGAHIQNATVTTALCSPSRASILTGQFSHKHGVVDNQTDIRPDVVFFPQTPTTFGVRTDRWKYIHYHGVWDIDELYDIQNDPDERNNLIDQPQHQDLVKKLRASLYDWLEKTDGMQIPLRREVGGRSDKRGPKQVKELKYYGENR